MNLDRIINMVMRRLVGRAVNAAVDGGIRQLSKQGRRGKPPARHMDPGQSTGGDTDGLSAEEEAELLRLQAKQKAARQRGPWK